MAGRGNHGQLTSRRAHVALATLVLIIAALLFGPLLLDASHDLANPRLDRLGSTGASDLKFPVHSEGVTK